MSQRSSSQCVSDRWATQRSRSRFGAPQDVVLAIRKHTPMTPNVWRSFPSVCRIVIVLLAACWFFAGHAQAQNNNPIPVADVATLPLGSTSPINITMLANDTDAEMDTISFTGLGTCDSGFVINDNGTPADFTDDSLDYTPPPGFEGTALCDYNIDDGNGGTATGTVSVTMTHPSPTCDVATAYMQWDGGIPANETLSATSTNSAGDTATWTHEGPGSGDITTTFPRWFVRNSSNPLQTNRGGNGGAFTTIAFPAAVSNAEFTISGMFLNAAGTSNENQRITG